MAFPATPLAVGAELYLNSTWTSITSYIYQRDGVRVRRGRTDESNNVEAGEAQLTLNNRSGRFSPRNPLGAYYGQIGRNTPIRIFADLGAPWFSLNGATAALTTPDSAGNSIAGDLEIQWDGWLADWRSNTDLVSKYGVAGQRSWALQLTYTGALAFYWTTGGTTLLSATSTAYLFPPSGRKAIKVTMDVDNGAAGNTVKFWTANKIGGTWVQLGADVVAAGVTSIFDSTSSITLGKNSNTSMLATEQRVFEFRLYSGIGGTLRHSPKATNVTTGVSSFADPTAGTWTVGTGASVTNRHYRFWGEVAEWPQRWDVSGVDVYTPIVAAGILRRLSQGDAPLQSALRRAINSLGTGLVAYWPMEDAANALSLDKQRGNYEMFYRGTPTLANYSGFPASKPIPTIESAQFYGIVPAYTNTNSVQVRCIAYIPSGTADGLVLMRVRTNSSLGWIELIYNTTGGGSLTFNTYTNLSALSLSYGPMIFNLTNKRMRLSIEMTKNGTGVDISIAGLEVGTASGTVGGATNAGITLGSATVVDINPNSSNFSGVAVGHVTVETAITSMFTLYRQLDANFGEPASTRIYRLAQTENAVPVQVQTTSGESEYLGYQGQKSLVDILREAADSDGGILYEPRTFLGLGYRTAESLYSQAARVTFNYANELLQKFEPVDDDQNTRNKVTVTRDGGSSSTVEDTLSTMSTSAPPVGVGLYDDSQTISLWRDALAIHQAGWRVHLGTVDEARYPLIGINLAHPDFTADTELIRDALLADIGDRLVVTNLPAWLPPDAVSQHIQGTSEQLWQYGWEIDYNCSPASPYRVAIYNDTTTRYSNDTSNLAAGVTSTVTALSVAVPNLPLWTTTAGDFPFDIMVSGERMTVTNITGAASPQAFTVTRSVNGIVKAQAINALVKLYDPVYYGI